MIQGKTGKVGTDVQKKTADILVAEDDDGIRQLVEDELDSGMGSDYGIVTVKDGDEAWEYLTETVDDPPELVVLDVMMPNLDGFSVLERIRETEELEDVRVIVLTSRSREEDIDRALESGADDFVAKPFSSEELLGSVRTVLS